MKVFVIPSWYPHRCFPSEGRFVRDLVEATAALRPGWQVAVSLWGQGRGDLSPRHLLRSPACLLASLGDRGPREEVIAPNARAYHRGALSATGRLRAFFAAGLLSANRENLRRAAARQGPFDLLHAHAAYPAGWIALELAREQGLPYVVTEHMGPFPLASFRTPGGGVPHYVREPLERAAAVMAVSEPYAERLAALGFARPAVVPNVIDEAVFSFRSRPARPGVVFFTACHMDEGKGIRDLLRAAALFLARLPPGERAGIRFRLAGEGPSLADFQRQARDLALGSAVEWLGFLPRARLREELAGADCFVLPSHYESFGIVFVEAMASGRPSIATACGGPAWIVTPETGIVVPVGDVERLAEALAAVHREPQRFDPAAIRAAFERRFQRRVVVERLESVYRSALARGAGAA